MTSNQFANGSIALSCTIFEIFVVKEYLWDRTRLIVLVDLLVVRSSLFLLFASCGGLSWLHVSFFYFTLNTQYRIVSYRDLEI